MTVPSNSLGTINLLSSSEASLQEITCKFGNTCQRRKSLSGHSKIAEATTSSGEKLVITLEKLNEKDSKLQWDMFHEQLKYNKERDLVIQENARLTHANQGNLVQAIAGLTQVLSATLQSPSFPIRSNHPPYGQIHHPHLSYGASPNYSSTANHQGPLAYGVQLQQPTYGASSYQREPLYGPTSLHQPLWTKFGIVDATFESKNGEASNDRTNDKTASLENLISANEHDQ